MRTGDVIADRYQIEQAAGSGGMGTVFRCQDLTSGERVAMKVLRDANEDHVKRFAKEAEVLYKLRHPRIVRYIEHGRTNAGELFLVMEWLDGISLSQALRRKPMNLQDAYRVSLGLAEAVAVAHARGVLHRDIKPGNIVLVDDDVDQLKLLDFGLARIDRSTALTQTGELLGTPGYMSPEQARGDRDVDMRADVFSMGCVMFRCFTGRRAFEGEDALAVLAKLVLETPANIKSLRPGIPDGLDELVENCLAKVRDERPDNGKAVLAALMPLAGVVASASGSIVPPALAPELPSITVKEQRVMCLVLARLEPPQPGEQSLSRRAIQDNDRVRVLQTAVQPFGGTLDRLIDGTLLVSVASGPPAEQAARAGRCAVAMRAVLGSVPVALAAGRGMLAQGALLGEAIDRAAALLAIGRSNAISLDDAAAALMRDRFDVKRDEHGYFLRGVQAEDDYTRRLMGRPTSCVGRARELRNLESLFEECVSEPVSRAVLVTAPAGVGKSRLRYELLRRLVDRGTVVDEDGDEQPFQIWLGRGDPMSAGSAFGMVANALRQATAVRTGESIELRRRKIFARVRKRVAPEEQRRVAEFIGELIGTPFDDDGSVQLRAAHHDPMLMGDQMRRAFEDFVAAECRHTPVLMVLEDLHWGDLPSVSFLDSALRNLNEQPFMVLAFARPEVHELFPNLWSERDLQEIRLSRLTRKAAGKLVKQVLGSDISETITSRIIERAEGNAFYLEELIRAVAEGKGDKLPESVLAMVQSRMEELDGETRRVLRGASVFGQVFWRGGVSQLTGQKRVGDLDIWLTALEERELITRRPESAFPGETEYVFRHALLREAAYAALTENDRELGHRLAGGWLEESGEKEAIVLAEHFERGGDAAHAVRWYRRASEQALEGNDLTAALERAERGVTCGASGADLGVLRLLQADAHRWRGEFKEMQERAEIAMGLLPKGEAFWCKAVAESAGACRLLGEYDRMVKFAEELSQLQPLPDFEAAYTEAAARIAMQLFIIGWAKQGDGLLARVTMAESLLATSHPSVVAWIHHARAFGALYAGDPGAYLNLCEAAAAKFEQAGDLRSVASARVHLGFAYIEVGGWGDAEVALRHALSSAQRMGLRNVVATALNNLGIALARLDQLEEALQVEAEAAHLASAQGDQRIAGASHHYCALIHMLRKELGQAEAEAQVATEMLKAAPPLRAHALATFACVRLAQQRPAEAMALANEAMGLLDSLGGIEEGEASVRLVHAEALHASGEQREACRAITLGVARLDERARKIKDARWRQSFLRNVPDNARTLSLANAWGISSPRNAISDEATDSMEFDPLHAAGLKKNTSAPKRAAGSSNAPDSSNAPPEQ
jgi:tetratricopeptide (TPR) repeat protein